MHAYLEPVTFVLRVSAPETSGGPMPHPYIGSGTVTIDDQGVATIRGFTMKDEHRFTEDVGDAVLDALARIGAREVIWSRKVGGRTPVLIGRPVPDPGPTLYI